MIELPLRDIAKLEAYMQSAGIESPDDIQKITKVDYSSMRYESGFTKIFIQCDLTDEEYTLLCLKYL